MYNLGAVKAGSVIHVPFSTFDRNGQSISFTGTNANIKIYKETAATPTYTARASTAGVVLTKDIGDPGRHILRLDLADNSDAGFWAAGSRYFVAGDDAVIDSQEMDGWLATFAIYQLTSP